MLLFRCGFASDTNFYRCWISQIYTANSYKRTALHNAGAIILMDLAKNRDLITSCVKTRYPNVTDIIARVDERASNISIYMEVYIKELLLGAWPNGADTRLHELVSEMDINQNWNKTASVFRAELNEILGEWFKTSVVITNIITNNTDFLYTRCQHKIYCLDIVYGKIRVMVFSIKIFNGVIDQQRIHKFFKGVKNTLIRLLDESAGDSVISIYKRMVEYYPELEKNFNNMLFLSGKEAEGGLKAGYSLAQYEGITLFESIYKEYGFGIQEQEYKLFFLYD